jgi:uncharacterized protein
MNGPDMFERLSGSPSVGIAYSSYVPSLLNANSSAVDYVEVPFELLCYDPKVGHLVDTIPVILHCASLSIAGFVPPPRKTIDEIEKWIVATKTPWLGEHLSFIVADRMDAGPMVEEVARGEPYNIGYTVTPVMNEETIGQVLKAIDSSKKTFSVPLLLENPPLYFTPPGSSMSQIAFINEICARSDVNLLLDLSHLFITSRAIGADPLEALASLPLHRVVEVHVSGVEDQGGAFWDNHAARAPEAVLGMLRDLVMRARIRAITLEYNWCSQFPVSALLEELDRVRETILGRPTV